MNKIQPFHLAIPVHNLNEAYDFYIKVFQCETGRTSNEWIDLNFFGHQLVLHLKENHSEKPHHNSVDGHAVPVPHFGVILEWNNWEKLAAHCKTIGIKFEIEPYIRFQGQVGEQATMFFYDPSGNALEFKAFKDEGQIFAK